LSDKTDKPDKPEKKEPDKASVLWIHEGFPSDKEKKSEEKERKSGQG
jgi:hypothetical protein